METFRRAVVLDPTRTAFRVCPAARLWENEQYMQAIYEWQTIAGQEPRNVEAHLALARAYLKAVDRERAWREYGRVLALTPGHAEAKECVAKLEARP